MPVVGCSAWTIWETHPLSSYPLGHQEDFPGRDGESEFSGHAADHLGIRGGRHPDVDVILSEDAFVHAR